MLIAIIAYGIWKWINLQRRKKHLINIVGAIHNLRIPKQDMLKLQQSDEHQKSSIHQSLSERICNHLKFNAIAMDLKLKPAAENAEPSGETNVQLDMFLADPVAQPTEETHAKSA